MQKLIKQLHIVCAPPLSAGGLSGKPTKCSKKKKEGGGGRGGVAGKEGVGDANFRYLMKKIVYKQECFVI